MSQWDKLLDKVKNLSQDLRFEELKKVYGILWICNECTKRRKQMRTIEEYMKLPYKMEIVPDIEEGGYVVSFPDLPGCLTIGDTVEEAIKNAEDAKYAWFEATMEDGTVINEPDDIENYSGQFKLRIPKSLHKSLSEHSKAEGISMNQYCLYLLAKNDAAYVGE